MGRFQVNKADINRSFTVEEYIILIIQSDVIIILKTHFFLIVYSCVNCADALTNLLVSDKTANYIKFCIVSYKDA